MTIHAVDKNFMIREIPVAYRDRPEGSVSKLNTYKDGFKVLKLIATLFKEYKPFFFFNIVSVLLAIISLIFLVPVFKQYFATGLVLRFPTLIVGGFIMVASILSFICGVILDVIVKKHKQLYEIQLNLLKKEE